MTEIIDEIAERIRMLGFEAPASLTEFSKLTTLNELSGQERNSKSFIEALVADHESVIQYIRPLINSFAEDFDDAGTSDYITSLIQIHEKMTWFLKAHIS